MTGTVLIRCTACGQLSYDPRIDECSICRGEPNRSQPLHTPRYLAPATVRREGAMRLSALSRRSLRRVS